MSVESFCRVLHEAKLGKNDQEWFPRWIRRYASSVEVVGAGFRSAKRKSFNSCDRSCRAEPPPGSDYRRCMPLRLTAIWSCRPGCRRWMKSVKR